MTILVTGASGFVGSALIPRLKGLGYEVRPVDRNDIGDIGPDTNWAPQLSGIEMVIHLAARVHVMDEKSQDPLVEYRRVNTAGTARLARAAIRAGVRRFVYISTIKVNGDRSTSPLSAKDPAEPSDAYGLSKWEAEQELHKTAREMELVTLRPPLIYGPGVKGNFEKLLAAVDRGTPFPLASIANRRSLIGLNNFISAIAWSLTAPPGTYLPSDREDHSTPQLISAIAKAFGKPARLIPCPVGILRFAGMIMGKSGTIDRLTGTLTVDGVLPNWHPPESFEKEIKRTVEWYKEGRL